jgi:hypothetical protein
MRRGSASLNALRSRPLAWNCWSAGPSTLSKTEGVGNVLAWFVSPRSRWRAQHRHYQCRRDRQLRRDAGHCRRRRIGDRLLRRLRIQPHHDGRRSSWMDGPGQRAKDIEHGVPRRGPAAGFGRSAERDRRYWGGHRLADIDCGVQALATRLRVGVRWRGWCAVRLGSRRSPPANRCGRCGRATLKTGQIPLICRTRGQVSSVG